MIISGDCSEASFTGNRRQSLRPTYRVVVVKRFFNHNSPSVHKSSKAQTHTHTNTHGAERDSCLILELILRNCLLTISKKSPLSQGFGPEYTTLYLSKINKLMINSKWL